jgi:hypothetical protein
LLQRHRLDAGGGGLAEGGAAAPCSPRCRSRSGSLPAIRSSDPEEGNKRAKGDFRGIKLSNKTHRSGSDPDALLARKSNAHPAQPSYRLSERTLRCDGHVLMDNRHALIVDYKVTQATGTGERDAAKAMAADRPGAHQKTIGADKNYETSCFVTEMHRIGMTPHTARSGGSAIDGRTDPHQGYAKSINARRGIEEVCR